MTQTVDQVAGGVVTFGEVMALLSAPRIGPLRHAAALDLGVAGAESNLAVGVVRLGTPVRWVGRVGDDELGRLCTETLRGQGVEVTAVVDPVAPTGLMLKEQRTALATRVLYYRSGSAGSRLEPGDLDEASVRSARVLHATGITPALSVTARETTLMALGTARAAGVTTSFDLNHRAALWPAERAAQFWREALPLVDVVFATEAEAAMLLGRSGGRSGGQLGAAGLARELAALGPATAIVKRGSRGAVAVVDGELREVPALAVAAVDPVGAGDAFAAGYLAALCAGEPVIARLELAARTGAFAVTVRGDWEGAPTRAELGLLEVLEGDVLR